MGTSQANLVSVSSAFFQGMNVVSDGNGASTFTFTNATNSWLATQTQIASATFLSQVQISSSLIVNSSATISGVVISSNGYIMGGSTNTADLLIKGNVAIGDAALSPARVLYINKAFTNSSGDRTTLYSDVTHSGGTTGSVLGSFLQARITGTGTYGNAVAGVYGEAVQSGASDATYLIGNLNVANQTGTGRVEGAYGTFNQVWKGAGHFQNAYGMYYEDVPNTNPDVGGSAGKVINQYGTYIGGLARGTSTNIGIFLDDSVVPNGTRLTGNFGVLQEGNDKNYFGGRVGIGYSSPTASLQVSTAASNVPILSVSSDGVKFEITGDSTTVFNPIFISTATLGYQVLIGSSISLTPTPFLISARDKFTDHSSTYGFAVTLEDSGIPNGISDNSPTLRFLAHGDSLGGGYTDIPSFFDLGIRSVASTYDSKNFIFTLSNPSGIPIFATDNSQHFHFYPPGGNVSSYSGQLGYSFAIGSSMTISQEGKMTIGTLYPIGGLSVSHGNISNEPILTISTGGTRNASVGIITDGFHLFQITGDSSTFANQVYFSSPIAVGTMTVTSSGTFNTLTASSFTITSSTFCISGTCYAFLSTASAVAGDLVFHRSVDGKTVYLGGDSMGAAGAASSGGSSALAVGTGSAVFFGIVSSPTAIINFSSPTFSVKLTGGATAYVDISSITVAQLQSTGTYRTLQDFINLSISVGAIAGGDIKTAGTSGKVDVSSGMGWIKSVDLNQTQAYFFDWPSSSAIPVPLNSTRYIGVQYNGGNPLITPKTADTWDYDTEFPLGIAVNDGAVIYIASTPWQSGDNMTNVIERFESLALVSRDNRVGGLILSNTGTRNISVTAGTLLARMSEFTISALDTSGSSKFDAYYRDGGTGFTKETAQTQWNNTQYDDGDGTLGNITALSYSSRWFYVMTDGSLAMMYGRANDTSLASALNDSPPSTLPDRILKEGILIGRFIIQASGTTPASTQSAFGTAFTAGSVTSFSDLSGTAKVTQVDGYESFKSTTAAELDREKLAIATHTTAISLVVSTYTAFQVHRATADTEMAKIFTAVSTHTTALANVVSTYTAFQVSRSTMDTEMVKVFAAMSTASTVNDTQNSTMTKIASSIGWDGFQSSAPYRSVSLPADAWLGTYPSSGSWINGGFAISSITVGQPFNRFPQTYHELGSGSTYFWLTSKFSMPFEWDGSSIAWSMKWHASSGTADTRLVFSLMTICRSSATSTSVWTSSTSVFSAYRSAEQTEGTPISAGFNVEGTVKPGDEVRLLLTYYGGNFVGIPKMEDVFIHYRQAILDGKPR